MIYERFENGKKKQKTQTPKTEALVLKGFEEINRSSWFFIK